MPAAVVSVTSWLPRSGPRLASVPADAGDDGAVLRRRSASAPSNMQRRLAAVEGDQRLASIGGRTLWPRGAAPSWRRRDVARPPIRLVRKSNQWMAKS